MKLMLAFIRSGKTHSGKEGKYLGCQDEGLLRDSVRQIEERAAQGAYPEVELVYTSGYLRCLETANLIYPQIPAIIMKELKAFDYGIYTGKTYSEVVEDKLFHTWSQNKLLEALPEGEDPYRAMARGVLGFRRIADEMLQKGIGSAGIVAHRLSINAILQRYCVPRTSYANWKLGYGEARAFLYDTKHGSLLPYGQG